MPSSNPAAEEIARKRLVLDQQKAARASQHMGSGEEQGMAGLRLKAAQLDQGERRFQAANALATAAAEERRTNETYNNTLKYYQTTSLIAKHQMETRKLADAADFQKGYSMIDKFDPNRSNKIAKLHAVLPYAALDPGVQSTLSTDDDELKQLRAQGALPSAATTLKSIQEGTISKDDIPKLIGPDGEVDHSKASLLAAERLGEAAGKPQAVRAKLAKEDETFIAKYAENQRINDGIPAMKAMYDIKSKRHLDYLKSQSPEAAATPVPIDAGTFVPRKTVATTTPAPVATPVATPVAAPVSTPTPAPVAAPAVAPSAIPPASTPKEEQVNDWSNARDAQSL